MSATPRRSLNEPRWVAAHPSPVHAFYSAILCDGIIMLEGGKELVDEVVRQHNAFDALLAVAKDAVADGFHPPDPNHRDLTGRYRGCCWPSLAALDAMHPDWRTW